MTELMRRYEAETGKTASFSYVYLDGNGTEQVEEMRTAEYHFWAVGEAECLNKENIKLKAQLTWRPIADEPEKDGEYFTKVNGMTGNSEYSHRYGWRCSGVTHYLPIPPMEAL